MCAGAVIMRSQLRSLGRADCVSIMGSKEGKLSNLG